MAKKRVNWKNIVLNKKKSTIYFSNNHLRIDLSGIAKGYAADKATEYLKIKGIKNAIVDIGGDIYCLGEKSPDGYTIGIQHPRSKNKLIATLKVKNKAVATSGDYENFFIYGGKRYSHIINPLTGYPIQNSVVSVTIIAPQAALADGLATGVMVMNPDKGIDLINKLDGAEAIIIIEKQGRFDFMLSKGISRMYKFKKMISAEHLGE
jgi:thiamine biosynthesis lipoprotein